MKVKTIFFWVICMSIALNLFAQKELQTKKVSVFKNGTGFFIRSGEIQCVENQYILESTPEALFGTMWVDAGKERIRSIKLLKEKGTEETEALSVKDMLKANIGKSVTIVPKSGDDYLATILTVKPGFVFLKSKDKWLTIADSSIKSIEFNEEPSLFYNEETDNNKLALEFNSPGTKKLELKYLEKGIGWFPNYLIELEDDKHATLTLRSTLVNDAEDLINTEVNFVVGVPNFKYSYLSSPLSVSDNLEQILRNLNNNMGSDLLSFDNWNPSMALSNAITSQSMQEYRPTQNYSLGASVFSSAENESQEDLYFYKHKNVSLKRGERASFELLHASVPFEHIYEVTIPTNSSDYSYFSTRFDYDENKNEVWHSIKLKNNTSLPWTTGTALVVKNSNEDSKAISQDIIKYTPVSGDAYLKITVSPDISVKDKDKEINRKEKSRYKNNRYYDQVTVEGSVLVKNFKNDAVKLSIKRDISGKLISSELDWKTEKTLQKNGYYGYNGNLNPLNKVEWEVALAAGEEKEITYSYTIYVYN